MKIGDLVAIKFDHREVDDPFYIGIIISITAAKHIGEPNGLFFVVFADGSKGDFWKDELEVLSENK